MTKLRLWQLNKAKEYKTEADGFNGQSANFKGHWVWDSRKGDWVVEIDVGQPKHVKMEGCFRDLDMSWSEIEQMEFEEV